MWSCYKKTFSMMGSDKNTIKTIVGEAWGSYPYQKKCKPNITWNDLGEVEINNTLDKIDMHKIYIKPILYWGMEDGRDC